MRSINYSKVKTVKEPTIKTGNKVFDKFLSNDGGFVVGSAIFLTGTPGAGKTTLSIVLQKLLENCVTSLYSREMSSSSLLLQMERYKIQHKNAFIADKNTCKNLDEYVKELDELKPVVVIIDSLQVIIKEDYAGAPQEICAFNIIQRLRAWTEANNAILIVIGHVNKNGEFEGRNTIEHMFDAHLEMIFNKVKNTRTLSWTKNRKGPSDQTLFYMFGDKSIDFYTKEQFQHIKENKQFEDFIVEAMTNYLNSLDNSSENYKAFKKELKKEFDSIANRNCSFLDKTIKCIHSIKEKVQKYKL